MPSRPRGRFKNLDERQRKALADYLTARVDCLRAEREYAQQLLDTLQNPAPGDKKRIRKFVSDVLSPARGRMRMAQLSAVSEAADVDVLAELVPTVVGSLAQAVDIPMLFATLNIDNELIDQVAARATPVIRRFVSGASRNRRAAG